MCVLGVYRSIYKILTHAYIYVEREREKGEGKREKESRLKKTQSDV